MALNPEIINKKDREWKDKVIARLNKIVEEEKLDPEKFKKELKEFDTYRQRDLQSSEEKLANDLLNLFKKDKDINAKFKFNEGFKNYELNHENIYFIYEANGKVNFRPVVSKNFFVLGLNSNWVQDAYAWIEETYMNAYKVLELFPDLKDSEIKKIMNLTQESDYSMNPTSILFDGHFHNDNNALHGTYQRFSEVLGSYPTLNQNASIDENGNIKVTYLQWRTLRKMGKLFFIDQLTGEENMRWVDEYYSIEEDSGERVEWVWLNEIYEGHLIGNDIYHKVRPLPVEMRSKLSPNIVTPSYVGFINFNSGGKAQSRLERIKAYQEDSNLYMNKLKKFWAQHIGKVAVVDVAKMPSKLSTDEWMTWLKRFNIMFINSFESGKEGLATGQLAGNMNQGSNTMDLSFAQEIAQTIQMLDYIESRVNKIAAVPEPRQGNLSGKEGLGISQQAIISSSNQTEEDFLINDFIKAKVSEKWLEYVKIINRNNKQSLQYVLDDLSQSIIELDGEMLNLSDYAVHITDSSSAFEMKLAMQQFIHPAMQNGIIGITDAIKMLEGTPSEVINRLDLAEEQKFEQNKEMEQMKLQQQEQAIQANKELEDIRWNREKEKLTLTHAFKMEELQFNYRYAELEHSLDQNQNGIEDKIELDKVKMTIESAERINEENLKQEKELKLKELENKKQIEQLKLRNKPVSPKK